MLKIRDFFHHVVDPGSMGQSLQSSLSKQILKSSV